MAYKHFKKEKPPQNGKYLWCENNWMANDINNRPVHRISVRIAYWDGNKFWDGDRGLVDPDQWSEIPLPKIADK